jgi:hypothetical protein
MSDAAVPFSPSFSCCCCACRRLRDGRLGCVWSASCALTGASPRATQSGVLLLYWMLGTPWPSSALRPPVTSRGKVKDEGQKECH